MRKAGRYWWSAGYGGFAVLTWQGEPKAENVVLVGFAAGQDPENADRFVAELNRLSEPVFFSDEIELSKAHCPFAAFAETEPYDPVSFGL